MLGADDGIGSTASLLVGVAAAAVTRNDVVLAGVAGLVAGAISMAAGEYVSVSSQSNTDTEQADLLRERKELRENGEFQLAELADVYVKRDVAVGNALDGVTGRRRLRLRGGVVIPQNGGVRRSPAFVGSKHHWRMTMDHYAGIDVSLEASSVCVVDGAGRIVREAKISSEPAALIGWLASLGLDLARIGLEAGPLSQWLYAAMHEAGLAVELLETRHVRTALQTMPVKTDRNDARGIAQLMRLGWFRPVHCKSSAAQETRALLTARKLVQSKLYDIEMSLRGILRGFGLKVGPTTPKRFARRIQELVGGYRTLEIVAKALLSAHAVLLREFDMFEKLVRAMARKDKRARLMMSAPGVGAIVALTYVSAIDDPLRFSSSKRVGPHFGLTPRKYQSGETDVSGRITKIGDAGVRTALYEAANVILTRPVKGSGLKSWAMKLARRAGMKKAKVALARKLAVVLHRMWIDGTPFDARKATSTVVAA
ncbi:IS110 family transposase (plasmid) [Methylocystis sp. MJC1]|nr:IS110 family transposase [Methylocystis sp. MJC1]